MYIVFDIGGTKLRLASSLTGETLNDMVVFPTPQNFDEAVQLLQAEITKLANGEQVAAIAGGIPAALNKNKTEILSIANLPDWSGKNLTTELSKIFNCPVKLENDAVLGALGEAKFGAGQNLDSLAYITIGTGIGGAWIINGQPVQGESSSDVGHQILDPNGPLCKPCQQTGHWEAYINQSDFPKYLVIGLHNTLVHWPTQNIILGGGWVLHDNWDLSVIQDELNKIMKRYSKNITIKVASLGDEAGLYGGLALLNNHSD